MPLRIGFDMDGVLADRRMRLAVRLDAGGRQVAQLAVTEGVNLSGIVEESVFEVPLEEVFSYDAEGESE